MICPRSGGLRPVAIRRLVCRTPRRKMGFMPSTPERERTAWVTRKASELGFDLSGVAPASRFPELEKLGEWLDRGHAGEMRYLHDPRRLSLERAMEGAKSVIVCGASYRTEEPFSTQVLGRPDGARPRGWISRYGWGDDYHDVLLPRLRALMAAMHQEFGEDFRAHAYVDTGPVVERVAAKYAGLGWLAKNTCLIDQNLGSFLFLGAIVTTLALEPTLGPTEAPPRDLCGSCRRCLDACPTEAFVAPYVMDPRRCIAYFTIELRGSIPREFRPAMGQMVFGCDICQDVCPWNQRAARRGASTLGQIPEFRPRLIPPEGSASSPQADAAPRSLFAPEIEWIASLDEEQYRRVFRRSPVKRAKYRGLIRNACVALGNSGPGLLPESRDRFLRLLERLAASPDELIAEHARWALDRLNAAAPSK